MISLTSPPVLICCIVYYFRINPQSICKVPYNLVACQVLQAFPSQFPFHFVFQFFIKFQYAGFSRCPCHLPLFLTLLSLPGCSLQSISCAITSSKPARLQHKERAPFHLPRTHIRKNFLTVPMFL